MTTTIIDAPAVHTSAPTREDVRDFAPYIKPVVRELVYEAKTPKATKTHCPVPHGRILDSVQSALSASGYAIGRQAHELSHGGATYHGVLEIKRGAGDQLSLFGDNNDDGSTTMLLGISNDHEKRMSMRLVAGMQVTVCSNGLFNGTVKVSTVHSKHVLDRLDRVVIAAVAKYGNFINKQREQVETYKKCELTNQEANDLFIRALQQQAISSSKLQQAVKAYYEPPHPEFADRNMWSWVNSLTEIYKGYSIGNVVTRSQRLHNLADVHCGLLSAPAVSA